MDAGHVPGRAGRAIGGDYTGLITIYLEHRD